MDVMVTGARGSQQSPVVDSLIERGHHVVALSRSAQPARPGLRWITGDLSQLGAVTESVSSIDGLAFHNPVASAPWPVEPLLRAAQQWGVKRVVFNASARVSAPGQEPGDSLRTVEALDRLGIPAAVLQPTLYLENLLLPFIVDDLQQGVLRYPLPARGVEVAWVASSDLGELASEALDTGVTGRHVARGPEALDGEGLAAALAEGLGRQVVFESQSADVFAARLAPLLGQEAAAGVGQMYGAIGAAPQHFTPWLNPDASPTRAAFDATPTSVQTWAAGVLRSATQK